MTKLVIGPTFEEMLHPWRIPASTRLRARQMRSEDPLDPLNLFNITWPRGGMRTVIIHRADKITGPYEGRVGLQDKGVAQGGLIDTPTGDWYAYLFRDYGAVGRIPYLVPVKWQDAWPVLGVDGVVLIAHGRSSARSAGAPRCSRTSALGASSWPPSARTPILTRCG